PSTSAVLFFYVTRPPPRSTLFPYTTLFRSGLGIGRPSSSTPLAQFTAANGVVSKLLPFVRSSTKKYPLRDACISIFFGAPQKMQIGRAHVLNSSHVEISYAVFCLKKKTLIT